MLQAKIKFLLFFMPGLFLLAGCGGLSKSECRTADWRIIGFEDGSRGYPLNRIGRHRSDCAEYGITPDMARYEAGHRDGILRYCQVRNGYQVGLRGRKYANVCPEHLHNEFVHAYQYGYQIYSLNRNLQQTKSRHSKILNDLKLMDDQIYHKEQHLVARHVPTAERILLLREIKELSAERAAMGDELHQLEQDMSALDGEIGHLKQTSPY